MSAEPPKYINQSKLAAIVGVTTTRIGQLENVEGIIKHDHKKGNGKMYEFMPTIKALLAHYRHLAEGRTTSPSNAKQSIEDEKLLQTAAKREMDELRLAVMKGNLHHTADVEKVFGAMLTRLRVGLLSLPQGAAPLLVDRSDINAIAEILQERLTRAMSELINFDFNTFTEYADGYDAEPETEETSD